MLGGSTELSVDDKDAVEAAEIGLRELRDRAVHQGTLDENSAFVRGEIVRARYQVSSSILKNVVIILHFFFFTAKCRQQSVFLVSLHQSFFCILNRFRVIFLGDLRGRFTKRVSN